MIAMKIEFEISEATQNVMEIVKESLEMSQGKTYTLNFLAHDILMQFLESQIVNAMEQKERIFMKLQQDKVVQKEEQT